MAKEVREVKEYFKTTKDVPKYFNTLAGMLNSMGSNYDKAVDMLMSGMTDIPDNTFRAVKAFLVKDGAENILDVNASGDVFSLSSFCALEELINEIGADTDIIGDSVVMIAFDVPLDEVPDDLLFGEDRESFNLIMKDYSSKEMKTLSNYRVKALETSTDPKTGRVSIVKFSGKGENKDFEIAMK